MTKQKRQVVDLSKPIYYSMESYSLLTENDVVSENEGSMILEPTLIEMDKISDNGSRYKTDDFVRSLNESIFFQRRFRANTLYGEFEHPFRESSLERIYHIEPTRYAWLIEDYQIKGDIIKGRCVLADPLGTQIVQPNMKRFGMNTAASLRSITEHVIERQDPGSGRVFKDKVYPIKVITFDLVTLPGFENARLMNPKEFASRRNNKIVNPTDSMESLVMMNDVEKEIKSLALRGDESIDIIQDIYGVDIRESKIDFVNRDRVVVSFENGEHFNMALDDYFLKEIL